ncbi:hypothetical protein K1T71_001864 [Dendrolimus kikuchii]|uniref:Uncharacterized protein n=1 Tax=Dendrolimus kikuchii TaxID=765133 RepID=A0ACC1DFB0_9NEOP|nr:hypothetical protein K1T71_001864 [Dendrolimus kikuchii]
MAMMAAPRKSVSIHDYPEHLNPFHEEDNHNKIRFWTLGRKLQRSNSITFSGIKDLKNSWAFRSFLRKGKKGQQSSQEKSNSQLNGDTSPIVYRRALHYSTGSTAGARSTVSSPERADRYVYGGSVTPLPRSRFQERLRSSSQYDTSSLSATPRMARSEVTGSRLSVESTNPFDEDPIPPVRASRRKKKRAPLPPGSNTVADISVTSDNSELHISETGDKPVKICDLETDEMNTQIELKIVEDEDVTNKITETANTENKVEETPVETTIVSSHEPNGIINDDRDDNQNPNEETKPDDISIKGANSEDDILNSASFSKVDIVKYRRNSSVNEDDIRLRRGNLEDFHSLTNKRSKSLTNALDTTYMTYDIDLNENRVTKDANANEEPQKLVCKLYDDTALKQSIDTISSTEKEFLEIDKATRELEREISKLNSALNDEDLPSVDSGRMSVSEIKRRFDKADTSSPNPIPKPRRSHYGGSSSP